MKIRHAFRPAAATMLFGAIAIACGCTSYYRVMDPAGERVYYTTDIKGGNVRDGGAINFIDDRTGSQVVLQSSEVKEITEEQYKQGVKSSGK